MTHDRFARIGLQGRRPQGLLAPLMWLGGMIATVVAMTVGAVLAVFTAAAVAVSSPCSPACWSSSPVSPCGASPDGRRSSARARRRRDRGPQGRRHLGHLWLGAAGSLTARMSLIVTDAPSPNFDARRGPPDMLVLHYTGMQTAEAAIARLRDPEAKVSGPLCRRRGRLDPAAGARGTPRLACGPGRLAGRDRHQRRLHRHRDRQSGP